MLSRAGDIDAQYEQEKERLKDSLQAEEENDSDDDTVAATKTTDDYADRSPAGFSFAEALHPKEDLKDIMRELGVLMDDDE